MQVWGRTYCKGGMISRASVQMCGNVLYIKIEKIFFKLFDVAYLLVYIMLWSEKVHVDEYLVSRVSAPRGRGQVAVRKKKCWLILGLLHISGKYIKLHKLTVYQLDCLILFLSPKFPDICTEFL